MHTMKLDQSLTESCEVKELTRDLLEALRNGTADLNQITVAEWIQVAFVHAMSNGIIHIEQPIVYGGQLFNVHLCMNNVGPSASLDESLTGTH